MIPIDNIIANNFTLISDDYKQFAIEKDRCRSCSVYDHYKQNIQSEGNAVNPTFMFVGESPGKDEIAQVKPFVGKAGQKLRQELRKYPKVFNKGTCLISNVLSCRPLDNKFPVDKTPEHLVNEKFNANGNRVVQFCYDHWLKREIKLVRPKVVVLLGSQSLRYLRDEQGISQHRGTWRFLPGLQCWSFATFHPSYVIRCENFDDDKHVPILFEQDIKRIAESWNDIIDGDPRMDMTKEEWDKERAIDGQIKLRLMKERPIEP